MSETNTKSGSYIGQAWLVILLSLAFGAALAGVQTSLSGRIAQNKQAETYTVIPQLAPGADESKTAEFILTGKDGKEARVYQALASDGSPKGWVVPASGQGFGDVIELLIGLSPDLSTITGLYVLNQKETPGLGDYITGQDFRDRFKGRPTDKPIVIVKSEPQADNEVRAITGATISSESVSGIVNTALANLQEPIAQRSGPGAANLPAPGPATE